MPDFNAYLGPLEELKNCTICPRNCHVNRNSPNLGYCRSDAEFNISSICIHKGEEPAVNGKKGICNIFFMHCNLQCMYCQNYQISDNRISPDTILTLEEVISQVTAILDQGIDRVGFVSPSHYIPHVKVIIAVLRSLGYNPVFVFNTNSYDKPEAIRSMEGLIDIYLPDLKYLEPELARNYSDAPDYPEIAKASIKEMFRQKGSALHFNDEGAAMSGIIIRHLVLPGHRDNTFKILQFIAEDLSPRLHVSLMSQYYPTPQVSCHPKLHKPISAEEYASAVEEMDRLGLHNGWVQELGSSAHYNPDFEKDHPFE